MTGHGAGPARAFLGRPVVPPIVLQPGELLWPGVDGDTVLLGHYGVPDENGVRCLRRTYRQCSDGAYRVAAP